MSAMRIGNTEVECAFYTRIEAAKRGGISVRSLDRQVVERAVPFKRVGRRVLFPKKAFDDWCQSLTLAMRLLVKGGI